MMKVLSLYFSGTNNTEYVESKIRGYLSQLDGDVRVDSYNVIREEINLNTFNADEYDLYLIGGPVYIEVLPHKLTKIVKALLLKGNNKRVVLFFTAAGNTPPALYGLYKYLTNRQYNVVSVVGFEMINNYYMSGSFGYTELDKRKELLDTCETKPKRIAEIINQVRGTYFDASLSKLRYYTGAVVYDMLKNNFIANYSKKKFASSIKCVACGICEKECPTKNVVVNKKSKSISFGNRCYACTRCIHICPKNAITFKDKEIRKMHMLE